MEFYFVLLLVAAVSADNDFYHVIPKTYTQSLYKTVLKPVQTPVLKTLETTYPVQTPVFKTKIVSPVDKQIQTQQIPTIFQAVPTVYQTVQTPIAHQLPTVYKVDDGKVYKVDDDKIYKIDDKIYKVDDDQDEEDKITLSRVARSADNEDFYLQVPTDYKLDDDKLYKGDDDKVYKIDDDKIYKIEEDDDNKFVKLDRVARSADNEDFYLTNDDNTHIFKLDDDAVDEIDDDLLPYSHLNFRYVRSADNIEVKKTDSHFLNLLTNKPKTTQIIAKTSQNVFTHTPLNNVATTLIHNTKPVDNVHIVAPRVFVPTNTPVVTTNFKTVNPVHTPISNVGIHNTLIHNTKAAVHIPTVQDDTIEVVAPRMIVNPTFKSSDIKIVNPVQTPLIKTFNTPAFRTIVQQPIVKTLETTDIVNPVQKSVQFQTVQTPVQIQTPIQYQAIQTPIQYQTVQTPVQFQTVQTPVFKTLETSDIVNPATQIHSIQTPTLYTNINNQVVTPVQLVNQPIFKTVATPVVHTMVQTPLTPGYVAATPGAVHTAPLPEGPSNDGFFASHHINLPNLA